MPRKDGKSMANQNQSDGLSNQRKLTKKEQVRDRHFMAKLAEASQRKDDML
jgi:hypothetical protein